MAGLAGLALAGALLAAGRGALIEAASVEPFRVEVASPHAPAADGRWTGRVVPPELAARAVVRVDGEVRAEGHVQKDMSGAGRRSNAGHMAPVLQGMFKRTCPMEQPGTRATGSAVPRDRPSKTCPMGHSRSRWVTRRGCG
ncbi:hypothetical protein [Nannocystis pusilla]|uniref:hypothetical protein n=1 Tax=Nannocystis pusilla TaxID=889268 RepID=UPI003B7B95E3